MFQIRPNRTINALFRLILRCRSSKAPRVRFAPSPTGNLHLGGLRTALYNYLFALSKGGSLILRIEDTDQSRKVDGAMEKLINDLEWTGIKYHEGPLIGGKYGPYVQSERVEIYGEQVKTLLDSGAAYRCFCTDKRLELIRKDALRNRQTPKYDNKCRSLSSSDVEKKLDERKNFCIRFKLTDDIKWFDDMIYGSIAYDVRQSEGDPVIMKTDGFPTYHFANVVDDYLMEITHVLRGVEWQISTTKHLMLYRSFGWEPPKFGHLPLIVNADGTKLSKRQGDIAVSDYRNKGIFPLSLVNYITLSGGGFDHMPGSGVRLKTYKDLAHEFDISKISSHPTRLNKDLLGECNRLEIERQLKEDNMNIVRQVQQLVRDTYKDFKLQLSDDHVKMILKWATKRINNLNDLTGAKMAFLWILPDTNISIDDNKKALLQELIEVLSALDDFNQRELKNILLRFSEEKKLKFSDFMKFLRTVLSGLSEGPSVVEMFELLGKETSLQRIKNLIAK